MRTEVNELIKIFVFFEGGKITPIAFSWHGRRYDKLKLITSWSMKRGQYLDQHFSLSDGLNTYEVVFDTKNLKWELTCISSG